MHTIFRKILITTGVIFIFNGSAIAQENSDPLFLQRKFWVGASYDHTKSSQMIGVEGVFNYELPWGLRPTLSLNYMNASFNGYIRPCYSDKNEYIYLTPSIMKKFQNGFYLKTGVGATYQKEIRWQNRRNGSHYQFHPTISAGYEWDNLSLEFQVSHFSSARTSLPNPGIDFAVLKLGYTF